MNWLKQMVEVAQTLLRLTDDVKQTKSEIKEIRKELRELSDAVKLLAYEVHRTNERESSEREKLLLKVENQLLKAGRQLPPPLENN
jgi:predicted  nucleic acid-binding Zn-ribbon protein